MKTPVIFLRLPWTTTRKEPSFAKFKSFCEKVTKLGSFLAVVNGKRRKKKKAEQHFYHFEIERWCAEIVRCDIVNLMVNFPANLHNYY